MPRARWFSGLAAMLHNETEHSRLPRINRHLVSTENPNKAWIGLLERSIAVHIALKINNVNEPKTCGSILRVLVSGSPVDAGCPEDGENRLILVIREHQ